MLVKFKLAHYSAYLNHKFVMLVEPQSEHPKENTLMTMSNGTGCVVYEPVEQVRQKLEYADDEEKEVRR